MESRIKDYNYYQVTGWMLNILKLKGAQLEIYAIIYGFSQDGESTYNGSINYLCDFTNTSRPTVIKALKELVEKEYIIKYEYEKNNIKFNEYKVNLSVVKNLYGGSKETLQGVVKNLYGGSKETLPNNNIYNNKYNNIDNKERKKVAAGSYNEIIDKYTNSNELKDAIKEFIKMRKLIKKPLTDKGLKLILNKIDDLGKNDNEKISILNQSVINSWQGVFELKTNNKNYKQQDTNKQTDKNYDPKSDPEYWGF